MGRDGWTTRWVAVWAMILAVCLLAVGSHARAQSKAREARIDRLEVLVSGFYVADKTGEMPAAGTTTGHIETLANIKFLDRPPSVTAQIGTAMGVRFKVIGTPKKGKAQLRAEWHIPEPGARNPNGNIYRLSVSDLPVQVGETTMRGYALEQQWEVVKGRWTFQVWQGERKLLEESFDIE